LFLKISLDKLQNEILPQTGNAHPINDTECTTGVQN